MFAISRECDSQEWLRWKRSRMDGDWGGWMETLRCESKRSMEILFKSVIRVIFIVIRMWSHQYLDGIQLECELKNRDETNISWFRVSDIPWLWFLFDLSCVYDLNSACRHSGMLMSKHRTGKYGWFCMQTYQLIGLINQRITMMMAFNELSIFNQTYAKYHNSLCEF